MVKILRAIEGGDLEITSLDTPSIQCLEKIPLKNDQIFILDCIQEIRSFNRPLSSTLNRD